MPSPRVERWEPLHDFWVLIGYGFLYIDDVVAIRYVIDDIVAIRYVHDIVTIGCITAVEIAITDWDWAGI